MFRGFSQVGHIILFSLYLLSLLLFLVITFTDVHTTSKHLKTISFPPSLQPQIKPFYLSKPKNPT